MAVIFPQFGSYAIVGDTISVEHDGFKLVATIHEDTHTGAPWKEDDGHGPVSEWTTRSKRAGERILAHCRVGDSYRYYDFAEALKIAKRDGWGLLIPYRTPGIARLAAVEADFQAMKAWANDKWFWCGIVVRVYKADVCLTSPGASLWGIECNYPNSDNSYLSEVASGLSEEALEMARAKLKELCECPSN